MIIKTQSSIVYNFTEFGDLTSHLQVKEIIVQVSTKKTSEDREILKLELARKI